MADSEYLDILQWREGKKRPVLLGYAKANDKGGFFLNFDCLPFPDKKNEMRVQIAPRQKREDGGGDDGGVPF